MAESDDAVVGYHVGGRHFDTYWGAQKAKVFQAGANAAYGVQSGLESVNNFVIGLGTALLPPARNFYRNFGFLGHTPDWSRDRFVPESDFGHKATTILGSLGIETIFGYGIARVARFFQLPSQGAQVRPREGIYEFPDVHAANKPYVGQSGNLARRLDQHAGVGRFAPGTESATEVLGGKTAREIAEHNRIQQLTGGQKAKNSPNVSNKCDPIGPERRPKLGIPEPRD